MNKQTKDKQIIYWYKKGIASYLIAKKYGVSNNYVRRLLERNGIKIRGHNITNKVSAQRRSPKQNKAITAKASEANRGSVHTATHRAKLALSREQNPKIDPRYEKPLIEFCEKNKIKVIPQKAFYKYNVDLYLPEKNVVIEVFGGGFHNKKEAVATFNGKLKYLSKKNIPVVIVWTDKDMFNPAAIIEQSLNVKEQLKIITGDGNPSIRGLKDINV